MSALHQAALTGNCDVIKTLLEHGAVVDITDSKGNSVFLHILCTWNIIHNSLVLAIVLVDGVVFVFLCAPAHLFICFPEKWAWSRRLGTMTLFFGFGPRTTLDGKWAAINVALTFKISASHEKIRFSRGFCLFVCYVTLLPLHSAGGTNDRHQFSEKHRAGAHASLARSYN